MTYHAGDAIRGSGSSAPPADLPSTALAASRATEVAGDLGIWAGLSLTVGSLVGYAAHQVTQHLTGTPLPPEPWLRHGAGLGTTFGIVLGLSLWWMGAL